MSFHHLQLLWTRSSRSPNYTDSEYAVAVRTRLDLAMVKRGLCVSRSEAADLIAANSVSVSGAIADKASRLVGSNEPIVVITAKRFVSRGGEKLDHALEQFGIDVTNRSVLDAGASTGGFTDCVLSRGAKRVAAFDVGRGQLHEKILNDSRVESVENFNVRDITVTDLPFPCSLIVVDLSFISLSKVLPALVSVATPEDQFEAELVLLVKPQFEAGRGEVSRSKGVITDPAVHERTVQEVRDEAVRLGCSVKGTVTSPIKGAEGNTEFLMHLVCSPNRSNATKVNDDVEGCES